MFIVICVHAWETNAHAQLHAGVNLYQMSTYKSCWGWSVSQFKTCMSLFRHGCQRQSFWNSQIDSQIYTFLDQMNWQFDQALMGSKLTSQNFAYRTQMTRNKRFLCFLFRENLLGINGFCSFVLRHPCPVHKINSFRISNRIENRRPALCLT